MTTEIAAGRYRIAQRIAAGGMGEVYRARMETLDGVEKDVALKLVRPDLASEGDFAELFVEELRVAMSLSHRNIVHAFDVGRIDDRWFLAMEYVEGVDLARLLRLCRDKRNERLPLRHALLVAIEALQGLDYAHRRKRADGTDLAIVHRDVSPGNVLVSFEGEVKIADFGIAKSTIRRASSLAGTVKGKLPYMAPEQLRGGAVDKRADLYSMGAVLYEMLTGAQLFDDALGTKVIPHVLSGAYRPPRVVREDVPEELERIVLRALAVIPSERYPSAAALRQELEAYAFRAGHLLSSADLGDFVRELCEAERPTVDPPRPNAVTPPVDPTTPRTATDPFDALLGHELRKIESTAGFSVFTTRAGQRIAPPRAASAQAPEADVRTSPPAVRPRGTMWLLLALTFACAAVAGWVATKTLIGSVRSSRDRAETIAARSRRTTVEDAGRATPHPVRGSTDAGSPPTDGGAAIVSRSARVRRKPLERSSPPPDHAAQSPAPAWLSVNTDPWSEVKLDGRPIGTTPVLRVEVPSGKHTLSLHNPSLPIERRVSLTLAPGEERRVTLDLGP